MFRFIFVIFFIMIFPNSNFFFFLLFPSFQQKFTVDSSILILSLQDQFQEAAVLHLLLVLVITLILLFGSFAINREIRLLVVDPIARSMDVIRKVYILAFHS